MKDETIKYGGLVASALCSISDEMKEDQFGAALIVVNSKGIPNYAFALRSDDNRPVYDAKKLLDDACMKFVKITNKSTKS